MTHFYRPESRFGLSHTLPTTEAEIIAEYEQEDPPPDATTLGHLDFDDDVTDYDLLVEPRIMMDKFIESSDLGTSDAHATDPISSSRKLEFRRYGDMFACPRCSRKFSSVATVKRHHKSSCLDLNHQQQLSTSTALPHFKKRQVQPLTISQMKQLQDHEQRGRRRTNGEPAKQVSSSRCTTKPEDPRNETYLPFLKEWLQENRTWLPVYRWHMPPLHQAQDSSIDILPRDEDNKTSLHDVSDDESSSFSLVYRELDITPSLTSPPDLVVHNHGDEKDTTLSVYENSDMTPPEGFDLDKVFAEFDRWNEALQQRLELGVQ